MAREAAGQYTAHLKDAPLPLGNGFEGQRVSNYHFSKSGNMLVSLRTIGVDDPDIFNHAVKIDDAIS